MPKTFCLLNHQLTPKQLEELDLNYHSTTVICSSEYLAKKWSQITPEESRETVVKTVVDWLQENEAEAGDLFIIQGEFGCTFTLVDYALQQGMIPLYATAVRRAKESREGELVHREYIFEHAGFKKYQYWQNKEALE